MNRQHLLELKLVQIGSTEAWNFVGPANLFLFPKSGSGQYRSACANQEMTPGDVLVIREDTDGTVMATNGSAFVFNYFALQIETLYPLFSRPEILMLRSAMAGSRKAALFPAASSVASKCHGLIHEVRLESSLEQRSQLLRIAAVIFTAKTAHRRRATVNPSSPDEHMNEVFERVSADELSALSVDEMAETFGCSRRHLNRLLRKHFGLSAAALRLEIKLLKAVSLLQNTNEKIIAVAEECQFNHLGLFNTYFKRRFGCSPSQWRQNANFLSNGSEPVSSTAAACQLRRSGLCPLDGMVRNVCPVSEREVG